MTYSWLIVWEHLTQTIFNFFFFFHPNWPQAQSLSAFACKFLSRSDNVKVSFPHKVTKPFFSKKKNLSQILNNDLNLNKGWNRFQNTDIDVSDFTWNISGEHTYSHMDQIFKVKLEVKNSKRTFFFLIFHDWKTLYWKFSQLDNFKIDPKKPVDGTKALHYLAHQHYSYV